MYKDVYIKQCAINASSKYFYFKHEFLFYCFAFQQCTYCSWCSNFRMPVWGEFYNDSIFEIEL